MSRCDSYTQYTLRFDVLFKPGSCRSEPIVLPALGVAVIMIRKKGKPEDVAFVVERVLDCRKWGAVGSEYTAGQVAVVVFVVLIVRLRTEGSRQRDVLYPFCEIRIKDFTGEDHGDEEPAAGTCDIVGVRDIRPENGHYILSLVLNAAPVTHHS